MKNGFWNSMEIEITIEILVLPSYQKNAQLGYSEKANFIKL